MFESIEAADSLEVETDGLMWAVEGAKMIEAVDIVVTDGLIESSEALDGIEFDVLV